MSGVFDLTIAVDGPATGAATFFVTVEHDLFLESLGLDMPGACRVDTRVPSTFSTIECRLLFLRLRFLSLRGGSVAAAAPLACTLAVWTSSRSLVSSESESTRWLFLRFRFEGTLLVLGLNAPTGVDIGWNVGSAMIGCSQQQLPVIKPQ